MLNKVNLLKLILGIIPILVSFYSLHQSNKALEYSKSQAESSNKQVIIAETQIIDAKSKSKLEIINDIKNQLSDTPFISELDNSFFYTVKENFNKNDFLIFSTKLEMITNAYNLNHISKEDIKDNFSSEINFVCRNFGIVTGKLENKKISILCNI